MYSKIGLLIAGAYSTPPLPHPPPPNLPAAKFASQGDAHMRTITQIKFLYYPLTAAVAPDLLKALAILSDTTIRRSAVDQKDLKPYWK